MQIDFATKHRWERPITQDFISDLGKNNRARLKSTLSKLPNLPITFEITPLTTEDFTWFTPLYTSIIGEKSNPKLFNIQENTLDKNSPYEYKILTLQENGKNIGATIFSLRKQKISIAYRAYGNHWPESQLQASPSLYTEYLINQYGLENNLNLLSHGQDRNPYGLNSDIGLAIFKLSVGCSPFLPRGKYEIKTIDLTTVKTDILIFTLPPDGNKITDGLLYVKAENQDKYNQLTKYPEQIKIEILTRPD